MFKKILGFLICLSFFIMPAGAQEKEIYTLSLNDAIELAKDDNPQFGVTDAKKKSAEINKRAAGNDKSKYKDAPIVMPSGLSVAYIQQGYYIELYGKQSELADLERKQLESKIAYDVTQKYYNYKLLERLVEITENACKLAAENKAVADKSYELGLISKNEVENAELNIKRGEAELENYKRNLDIAREDLKIALQKDGEDCDFVLTDGIEFEAFESNPEKDAEAALSTRYDLTALKVSRDLAKTYSDITTVTATANAAVSYTALSDYLSKDYTYTNSSKMIALSIRSSYNDILSKKNALEIAESSLSIKNKEYEAGKLKFEMGMISNIQLTALLNELNQCEIQLENAKLDYKLAVSKYQYEITIGL